MGLRRSRCFLDSAIAPTNCHVCAPYALHTFLLYSIRRIKAEQLEARKREEASRTWNHVSDDRALWKARRHHGGRDDD